MALLELCNVTAGYQGKPIFSNMSLKIEPGMFAGIVGPTGSGKTTLLKSMLGTLQPMAGNVLLGGNDISKTPPGTIGYVPQLETVDWSFPVTVEQVILMGAYTKSGIWPWVGKKYKKRAQELASRLGILSCMNHHIRDISGGQQQRAFLARALLSDPKLLVLDEPTAGVDIKTQHDVLHLLGEINRDGVAIVLTTHDLNAVAAHLPWVICFNKELIAVGKPDDIFTDEILKKTYGGNITIVKHEGHLLIANSVKLSL